MDDLINIAPLQTLDFFRRVLRFGFIGGAVLILPTAYVLLSSPAWAALAPCEMYFVAWLWVRLGVFFIQLPFRISIYARLLECQRVAVTSLASAVERFARLSRSIAWRVNQTFGMIVYIIFGLALFMLYWHWDFSFAEAHSEADSPDPPFSALAAGNSTLSLASELSHTVLEWIRLLPAPLTNLLAPFWSLLRVLLSFESDLTALIGSAVFGDMPEPDAPLMNSLQDPSGVVSAGDSVLINSSVACPMRQSPLLLAVFCHVAFFITHMIYSQFYLRRLIAALFPFEAAPGTSVSMIHQHTTLEPYQPQSSISSTDARLHESNSESVAQADICPICYVEYNRGDFVRRLSCRHYFHDPCISAWLKQKRLCPLCQHDIAAPFTPPVRATTAPRPAAALP